MGQYQEIEQRWQLETRARDTELLFSILSQVINASHIIRHKSLMHSHLHTGVPIASFSIYLFLHHVFKKSLAPTACAIGTFGTIATFFQVNP